MAFRDEDVFRLADETGRIRVDIGWRNRVRVSVGETVTAMGFVDDDLVNGFRPEVYANRFFPWSPPVCGEERR